ncbi:MAG: N-acetyltransferase, partial [Taibaiella sp.]|nr:N-acetyltransferase [Taibaiella sp.]
MGTPTLYQSKIVNAEFGENVKIVEPVNIYGCKLGNNCFVGPFVEIQKDVTIGNNTKIQSHAFVCELVTIGNDCFIGHGVMVINDLFQNGGP